MLAFVVTQQLIDQLRQLITVISSHLPGSEFIADFKVKTEAGTPCGSPGRGLATPVIHIAHEI